MSKTLVSTEDTAQIDEPEPEQVSKSKPEKEKKKRRRKPDTTFTSQIKSTSEAPEHRGPGPPPKPAHVLRREQKEKEQEQQAKELARRPSFLDLTGQALQNSYNNLDADLLVSHMDKVTNAVVDPLVKKSGANMDAHDYATNDYSSYKHKSQYSVLNLNATKATASVVNSGSGALAGGFHFKARLAEGID